MFRALHPQLGLSLNAFQDIAHTCAFPAFGKVSGTDRELGDVTPIFWDIIFATQANRDLLYKDLRSILDNQLDWVGDISGLLDGRDDLVRNVIQSTDAINPPGCQHIYKQNAIDSESMNLCDFNNISIKKFIKIRRNTLNEELSAAGF